MNLIRNIVFFGSNYKIVQILNRKYTVQQIVCERRGFNIDLYNYAKLNDIDFRIISGNVDTGILKKTDLAVSCGFGLIFKVEHINCFLHGIWNIHYGYLPAFRGRHPVSWAFLKNQKKIGITIHQINQEIDRGYLLAEGYVSRDLNDNLHDIENKIIHVLENGLFDKAVENYFFNNKSLIAEGSYLESLADKFVEISPTEYSSVFLYNLFKSQKIYGGVIVNGTCYSDCVFVNDEFPELYAEYDMFVCKDGQKIGLK